MKSGLIGLALMMVFYSAAFAEQTLHLNHPQTTALVIHDDGTVTFYDIEGNKVADYDPGMRARQTLMQVNNLAHTNGCGTVTVPYLNTVPNNLLFNNESNVMPERESLPPEPVTSLKIPMTSYSNVNE